MDGYNYDPMTGEPIVKSQSEPLQTQPKRVFTGLEKGMAWLAALLGYLFCRTFWVWQKPVAGLIFTVCLYAFAFIFFGTQKRKIRSWFYPISALLLSCALFFSASPVLLFFVFAYVCVSFLLFCQTGSATALEGHAGQLYFLETVKAIFVSPFKSIGAVFGAVGSNKGGKKAGKTVLIILAGIAVAVIPTVIVLRLLSFDNNFLASLEQIRVTLFDKIFTHILSLILGIPIGIYLYAALYTSKHPVPDGYNSENCTKFVNAVKFAPSLVGAVAIIPLLFLYGVFIYAQRDYYQAIFTSTLPDAYTFSEFARNGFFRLCAVAAINAVVLIGLRVFTKRTSKGKISPVVRIYTVVLSLATIVISGTAISQMIMYVSAYGLTRLRLYTLWFMALLILLFFVAVLKQLIEKLPFAAVTLTLAVLCFGILAVPDADAFIARHNYDCVLSDPTTELDVDYLSSIAPSSVPVLCEIAQNESLPERTRKLALEAIGRYHANTEKTANLPNILADKAYASLDRDLQRKAAVIFNRYIPAVYKSEETQLFSSGSINCAVAVYRYDKDDESVFTENDEYKEYDPNEQPQVAGTVRRYEDACKEAGKEYLLPFTEGDLMDENRFLIAYYGGGNLQHLYDRNTGCLVYLYAGNLHYGLPD